MGYAGSAGLTTTRDGCRAQGLAWPPEGRAGGRGDRKGRLTVVWVGDQVTLRKRPLMKLQAAHTGLPKSNDTSKCKDTFLEIHAVKILLPISLVQLFCIVGISIG